MTFVGDETNTVPLANKTDIASPKNSTDHTKTCVSG